MPAASEGTDEAGSRADASDVTLAFEAVADSSEPTALRAARAALDGDLDDLRPCQGTCVAGSCVLAFPFRHPAGGCCRVMTPTSSRRPAHHRRTYGRGAYAARHGYGYDDDEDNFVPRDVAATKV